MRVVILDGTGFIDSALVKALLRAGHDVTVSGRSRSSQTDGGPAYAQWDGRSPHDLAEICRGAAAVVNLLGENIGAGRWGPEPGAKPLYRAAFARAALWRPPSPC